MPGIEDRAKTASRYKVFQSVVAVQSWGRGVKGANESLNEKTINSCHKKLLETGSVCDKRRVDVFTQKSTEISAYSSSREAGLTRYAVQKILRKNISLKPWKPQYVQKPFLNDFDRRIEMAEGAMSGLNCLATCYGVTRQRFMLEVS